MSLGGVPAGDKFRSKSLPWSGQRMGEVWPSVFFPKQRPLVWRKLFKNRKAILAREGAQGHNSPPRQTNAL